ncbi:MAG TPA: ribonuclease P protein component [Opitutaceae bacterium]|nr:ribonuclease P protein component [Opitutaceae bacterium]HPG18808.1 ribonuclease P protein component [Opitutaceae bacterium]
MRFRSEQHLRRQSEISAVRERGRRVDGGAFVLWWRERAPEEGVPSEWGPRVCVVASKAAVGMAVARNRAKRRLREVFRKHQGLVAPGLDLMLVARSAAVRWDFEVLEQKFQEACRRLPIEKRGAADAPDAKQ